MHLLPVAVAWNGLLGWSTAGVAVDVSDARPPPRPPASQGPPGCFLQGPPPGSCGTGPGEALCGLPGGLQHGPSQWYRLTA